MTASHISRSLDATMNQFDAQDSCENYCKIYFESCNAEMLRSTDSSINECKLFLHNEAKLPEEVLQSMYWDLSQMNNNTEGIIDSVVNAETSSNYCSI